MNVDDTSEYMKQQAAAGNNVSYSVKNVTNTFHNSKPWAQSIETWMTYVATLDGTTPLQPFDTMGEAQAWCEARSSPASRRPSSTATTRSPWSRRAETSPSGTSSTAAPTAPSPPSRRPGTTPPRVPRPTPAPPRTSSPTRPAMAGPSGTSRAPSSTATRTGGTCATTRSTSAPTAT